MPENSAASSQERLLNHLRALGAAARTVEVAPHAMLRKDGVLATPEAVARVYENLSNLDVQRGKSRTIHEVNLGLREVAK